MVEYLGATLKFAGIDCPAKPHDVLEPKDWPEPPTAVLWRFGAVGTEFVVPVLLDPRKVPPHMLVEASFTVLHRMLQQCLDRTTPKQANAIRPGTPGTEAPPAS